MSLAVKVVLSDVNGGEVELGPYRMGVVVECEVFSNSTVPKIVDVASSQVITRSFGSYWAHDDKLYSSAFIQGFIEFNDQSSA